MLQSPRHSFGEGAFSQDTGGEHWIGRGEASTDDEGGRELGP